MNRDCAYSAAVLLLLQTIGSPAAVLYVNVNGTNPLPPYEDWSTAATNIQDAIDASTGGDQIWVTNGVYQTGGKVMAGDLTNRVALDKAVTVQSVNGPLETIIQGAFATNGPTAVRCAWLTNGAALIGFTLEGGATRTAGESFTFQSGGGVWCQSTQPIVANCIIKSNYANFYGGGVFHGNLENCLLYGNTAYDGGGALASVMNNCTVTRNWGTQIAGGTEGGYFTNCIVYFNSSRGSVSPGNPGTNYQFGSWSYSCAVPLPAGVGNIGADPQIFVDNIHLAETSLCRGAGTNTVSSTDIFGHSWSNPPSMGCAEWQPEPMVGALGFRIGDDGTLAINVRAIGQSPLVCLWTRNGTEIEDGSDFGSVHTTNLVVKDLNLLVGAGFQVVVTNAYGMATSAPALFPTHCVDPAGANPVPPYSTWATAATNIQDAIDAALPGDIVLVTNGVYGTGGRSMDGSLTNRVSIDKAIIVQSINGPASTIIQGAWDPVSTNGPGAVRCVWMTEYAVLNGFTLRGGATAGSGGGICASSTSAVVYNCIVETNFAFSAGGGAYSATLNHCKLTGNHARGPGLFQGGLGGGAASCILKNCLLTSNHGEQSSGGAAQNCLLENCALTGNRAVRGTAADQSTLLNCTVVNNVSDGYIGYGSALESAAVTNSIVYGNVNPSGSRTNYSSSCTFSHSNTDPLPSGDGNMDVDPQLLGDGIHLTPASPCIGVGTTDFISGKDIDDQPWKNPPSIGCDEWQPAPVIAVQPTFNMNLPAHSMTLDVVTAGQSPFNYFWSKDGVPIQDDTHRTNSATKNLVVNGVGLDDAGLYQVVVGNAFGVVTGSVQVVFHTVDAVGANPVAPYSTWATAATNIQDAIDIAGPGEIVFVTNGVYAAGGKVMAGDLTNRVALDKAVTVTSMNGYAATVIRGAWDPNSMTGLRAVRCVYLADGAVLNGFTLENGATRAIGNTTALQSGGGVWCVSANGVVSNCLLTNNAAVQGGGIFNGTLNNSLVTGNFATFGGGAYFATLNNCTVVSNCTTTSSLFRGAGTYIGVVRDSIVRGNFDNYFTGPEDNHDFVTPYSYSCTAPMGAGTGNINADPQFLDGFHIASTSPCRGAGSSLYAVGADFDGEPWASPPSMGCDEVVVSNLVGPLSVNVRVYQTNLFVNRIGVLFGIIEGRASRVEWSLGDGPTITNAGVTLSHPWTSAGDYPVTFAAFNTDNPGGVSTNLSMHVVPFILPLLQSAQVLSNNFAFQFTGQTDANYTVQYTTNLASPVTWQTLQSFVSSTGQVYQILDPSVSNRMRFYRVLAQ